jgi:hypothetical protein
MKSMTDPRVEKLNNWGVANFKVYRMRKSDSMSYTLRCFRELHLNCPRANFHIKQHDVFNPIALCLYNFDSYRAGSGKGFRCAPRECNFCWARPSCICFSCNLIIASLLCGHCASHLTRRSNWTTCERTHVLANHPHPLSSPRSINFWFAQNTWVRNSHTKTFWLNYSLLTSCFFCRWEYNFFPQIM